MEPVSSVSQELVCKAKALDFLKERETCNNECAKNLVYKYLGITPNPLYENELWFRCTIDYNSRNSWTMMSVTNPTGEAIIDMLTTKWKEVKTEDENENDTIAALLLGIMRLEDTNVINFQPNYLAIHEALVSEQQYDVETKRAQRALLLGMTPALKSRVEYKDPYPCSMRHFGNGWPPPERATSATYSIDYCNYDTLYPPIKHASLLKYK